MLSNEESVTSNMNKRDEGGDKNRHSDPPPIPPAHHRVHSTPTAIERHHSAPNFACNHWGNEKTRRSYKCLPALNIHAHHCIRRRRCTSCARLSDAFRTPVKPREWWGMFVDLSDVEDERLPVEEAKELRRKTAKMTAKKHRCRHDGNED